MCPSDGFEIFRGFEADTVVLDLQGVPLVALLQRDVDRGRVRVLADVDERFLRDAVQDDPDVSGGSECR